ncbi:MAG: IS982 family transposase [Pseudonocardiaceae bacterium]
MRALQKDNIVNLFVGIDDLLPQRVQPGRLSALTDSEMLTILIWDGLTEPHKNLSSVHSWIAREYHDYFPGLPRYQNFVAHCHRLMPVFIQILQSLLAVDAKLRFADSTMLPVCKPVRVNSHRVARDVADMGKNHQCWHYGFKLHAAIDHLGRLAAFVFTPANIYDGQLLVRLVNEATRVVVGDSHYGAGTTRKTIRDQYEGVVIIAPPHYKQNKQVMAKWQHLLLMMRPKIEAMFGKLKEQAYLVSSFPRSVRGYFVHYLRVLLGYQVRANS